MWGSISIRRSWLVGRMPRYTQRSRLWLSNLRKGYGVPWLRRLKHRGGQPESRFCLASHSCCAGYQSKDWRPRSWSAKTRKPPIPTSRSECLSQHCVFITVAAAEFPTPRTVTKHVRRYGATGTVVGDRTWVAAAAHAMPNADEGPAAGLVTA